jgi:formylglycine-generating enzyme required for sulfatase activity
MGTNPSFWSKTGGGAAAVANFDTDDFPVDTVSWDDAQDFCKKLSALPAERLAGRTYRLPTEAEWEYACRAGKDVKEPFTFDRPSASAASDQANFNGNKPYGGGKQGPRLGRTCKVGSYKANAFGLYDMHGNVVEWCQDWYGAATYSDQDRKDPKGPATGRSRMLRGGCYNYDSHFCRSAYRNYTTPTARDATFGIRAACDARHDR